MAITKCVKTLSHHQSFWARHDWMPVKNNIPSYEAYNIDFKVNEVQRFVGWIQELVKHREGLAPPPTINNC